MGHFQSNNTRQSSCHVPHSPQTHGHLATTVVPGWILRPPLQPDKYGLKLEVVLKWRDVYTENIRMVLLIAGLKIEGIVKWIGLKSQGPL